MERHVTLEDVDLQEERFARAFAAGSLEQVRDLYHPDVLYVSPTARLFGAPKQIEGVDATLAFINRTIEGCGNIDYRLDERAVIPGASAAYTRISFDWDASGTRLRSTYVVVYRYRDGLIARQELYYDPSGGLERVGPDTP